MISSRLEYLQSRLQLYLDCEAAILSGAQEYSIGTRTITRASRSELAKTIQYLETEIEIEKAKAAGRGRNRVMGIIPRDF